MPGPAFKWATPILQLTRLIVPNSANVSDLKGRAQSAHAISMIDAMYSLEIFNLFFCLSDWSIQCDSRELETNPFELIHKNRIMKRWTGIKWFLGFLDEKTLHYLTAIVLNQDKSQMPGWLSAAFAVTFSASLALWCSYFVHRWNMPQCIIQSFGLNAAQRKKVDDIFLLVLFFLTHSLTPTRNGVESRATTSCCFRGSLPFMLLKFEKFNISLILECLVTPKLRVQSLRAQGSDISFWVYEKKRNIQTRRELNGQYGSDWLVFATFAPTGEGGLVRTPGLLVCFPVGRKGKTYIKQIICLPCVWKLAMSRWPDVPWIYFFSKHDRWMPRKLCKAVSAASQLSPGHIWINLGRM